MMIYVYIAWVVLVVRYMRMDLEVILFFRMIYKKSVSGEYMQINSPFSFITRRLLT